MSLALASLATAPANAALNILAASRPVSKFDNVSDEMLADRIGDQSRAVKDEEAHLEELKSEARRRGVDSTGSRWAYTIKTTDTSRLDLVALKAKYGDKLKPFYKCSSSETLRITPIFASTVRD